MTSRRVPFAWTVLALCAPLLAAAPALADGVRVRVPDPPAEVGRWLKPMPWPIGPSHAAVLATGKVLLFGPPEEHDGLVARLWDPGSGALEDVSYDHHIHCSGHSFLPDGSLYVTGGHDHDNCPAQGREETNLFDPFSESWVPMEPMRFARYYPTNLTLADGRVLILSGLGDRCQFLTRPELYTPGVGLRLMTEFKHKLALYPMVHQLPDGRIAHVGPEPHTTILDLDKGRWDFAAYTRLGERRMAGTSFALPGDPWSVMVCGGFEELNYGPTETCEQMSYRGRTPKWREVAPMRFERGHANAVILPDKTVLMVGGGHDAFWQDPVYNAELFDPATGSWRLLPPQRYIRMHHSLAVLLPDGRVLSAGQAPEAEDHGHHAATVSADGDSRAYPAEIYRPPYLYRGRRPTIRRAPETAHYGESFEIRVRQAARIRSAVLVAPSAVTHSVNSTQRLVELEFRHEGDNRLTLTVPKNPNRAPTGYYMLFVLNELGVPSKARMIQVLFEAAATTTSG